MRSAWACAAWCFHSFGNACGRSSKPSTQHSGVPSRRTGSGVEAVKSVAMPTTCEGSTPLSFSAAGTAVLSTSIQSPGSCSAQWGGRSDSITPCSYSCTAEPTSAPSTARTTTARPESVPKSTPTTCASGSLPDIELSMLALTRNLCQFVDATDFRPLRRIRSRIRSAHAMSASPQEFPRKRRPVMSDVARLAGVSHQTVSRVINDNRHVRAETRERVELAMRQLDYRPNSVARALVTGRSKTLGVVSFDTTLYGPASTLYGIERAAHDAGYFITIASL